MKRLLTILFLLYASATLAAGTGGGLGFGSSDFGGWTTYLRQIPASSLGFDVIQGISFYSALCTQAAVTSRNSLCQLYNPAGSGVNIFPNTLRCWAGAAATGQLSEFDTARTTPVATANMKLTASQVSHGQVYADNIAAVSSTWIQQNTNLTTAINQQLAIAFGTMIRPGTGLEFEVQTQNLALNCEFFWTEAPQ